MKFEIKVPSVGESVTSADIESWEKQSGDLVKKGEILAILETDKASMEIPAENDGILSIVKNKGEKVSVGEVIGFIEAFSSDSKVDSKKTDSPAVPLRSENLGSYGEEKTEKLKQDQYNRQSSESKVSVNVTTQTENLIKSNQNLTEPQNKKEELSPSVRRLVETNQINTSEIAGTGRRGQLTKEDILTALQQAPKSLDNEEWTSGKEILSQKARGMTRKGQRREAMTRLRRTTAQRLVQSQHSTATLSTFNEVDLSRIIEIRKTYQEEFIKKQGIKLGFMSFFVQAVVSALKEYPRINAFIEGTDIVYNDHQHIGIAVSTEKGLVVPVMFHAESLSLAGIEKKIIEYRDKALSRKLTPDDLLGGTFTISNGGVFGSLLSTPLLNPPQSGILGMHKIEERPVARNGRVEIRPMMYVTLSYDHRIVDGRESVGFLVKVKEGLEEPARLIMDI